MNNETNKEMIYIYNNIYLINNHNNFIELLKINDCKYTTNSNGIFVNLNTLNEELIHSLFLMVKSEIKSQENPIYEINEEILKLSEVIKEEGEYISPPSTVNPSIKSDILKISDFNKKEQSIISLSKNLKL